MSKLTGAPASPSGSRPADQANLRCPDASRFDPSRGPRQKRLDDEGEALAHAVFYALNTIPDKKWRDASLHAKARFREAARAVRRVMGARDRSEIKELFHDLERAMTRENTYLKALLLIAGTRGQAAKIAEAALYGSEPHNDPVLASAIEARSDATGTGAAEGESATEGDAQDA